jgi:hypothetical protein
MAERLRVMEAKAILFECYGVDSVSCYYEDSGVCVARGIVFLDVEGCVKHDFMLKSAFGMHGKSPCFSSCAFLMVVRQGRGALFSGYVHGVEFLG